MCGNLLKIPDRVTYTNNNSVSILLTTFNININDKSEVHPTHYCHKCRKCDAAPQADGEVYRHRVTLFCWSEQLLDEASVLLTLSEGTHHREIAT